MSAPLPEVWERIAAVIRQSAAEVWERIAAVIRQSAASGVPIGTGVDLARAAGLTQAQARKRNVLKKMHAAGVLAWESGAGTTWILPREGIRSATTGKPSPQRAMLQDVLRRAIAEGRPLGSAAEIGALMGLSEGAAYAAIRRARARGLVRRDIRILVTGERQTRWGLPGLEAMTPWARLADGVRDLHAARAGRRATFKPAVPKPATPKPRPVKLAPLPPPGPPVDDRAGSRKGSLIWKERTRRIQLHLARCAAAAPLTEAEIRAKVDAYIRERGVHRIEAAPRGEAPMPVRGRGRSIGPGHAQARGR